MIPYEPQITDLEYGWLVRIARGVRDNKHLDFVHHRHEDAVLSLLSHGLIAHGPASGRVNEAMGYPLYPTESGWKILHDHCPEFQPTPRREEPPMSGQQHTPHLAAESAIVPKLGPAEVLQLIACCRAGRLPDGDLPVPYDGVAVAGLWRAGLVEVSDLVAGGPVTPILVTIRPTAAGRGWLSAARLGGNDEVADHPGVAIPRPTHGDGPSGGRAWREAGSSAFDPMFPGPGRD